MKKREFFKIEGDKINRIRKHCPKCGPGVFLAEHKNRFSCGQCGYTEFKGGVKPPIEKEKPIEAPVETKPETPIETTETKPPEEQPKVEPTSEPEPIKDAPIMDTAATEETVNKESFEDKSDIKESTGEAKSEDAEEKIEKKPKEESSE